MRCVQLRSDKSVQIRRGQKGVVRQIAGDGRSGSVSSLVSQPINEDQFSL